MDRPGGGAGGLGGDDPGEIRRGADRLPGQLGPLTLVVGAVAAILVAVAGLISWRAWDWAGARGDANGRFLAALSALTALLFAVSILLQGAAGFVFSDCHR